MPEPTRSELHRIHAEHVERLDERTATAWAEYLAMSRASAPEAYALTETFAWRRLKRDLAVGTQERRRVDFELDRALVELLGTRRAA